jgi:hypothetical protein
MIPIISEEWNVGRTFLTVHTVGIHFTEWVFRKVHNTGYNNLIENSPTEGTWKIKANMWKYCQYPFFKTDTNYLQWSGVFGLRSNGRVQRGQHLAFRLHKNIELRPRWSKYVKGLEVSCNFSSRSSTSNVITKMCFSALDFTVEPTILPIFYLCVKHYHNTWIY